MFADFANSSTSERRPLSYSLSRPPRGVASDSWGGSCSTEPAVGDLWLLSWDGEALGLVVVSGVAPSFVLAWPATLTTEPSYPPAVEVKQSPIGSINVWPSRETGIGTHLLHRNLGQTLSERTMSLLDVAFEEGSEPPLPFVSPNVQEADFAALSDEMVEHWEAINTHLWPAPILGATPLDSEFLQQQGISLTFVREVLGVSTPEAVALLKGEQPPSALDISKLAEALEMPPEELLLLRPDDVSQELLTPRIKDDVLRIADLYDSDESGARMLLREEFVLAARSDQVLRSRLDAAIHRLLERERPEES